MGKGDRSKLSELLHIIVAVPMKSVLFTGIF